MRESEKDIARQLAMEIINMFIKQSEEVLNKHKLMIEHLEAAQ